ncbi:probable thiopurine S-methyltransferase [Ylistrum balloti]|uniref:probable thiopurine S-methyltransferase n=1 Tax=Ylistrum balloti TaxID=509963 RepID=UPI002905871D|nr:probable thiopurine S-methyltransferase [Ylistrum balloti]
MADCTYRSNMISMETRLDRFKDMWVKGDTKWHTRGVNPLLLKHQHILLSLKKPMKVFVPLCGKDDSMKWLAEQGHTVVGVDFSDIACKNFFLDNNLEYIKEDIQNSHVNGHIYKAIHDQLNLSIYYCDYFQLVPELQHDFDAVWDRGALNAMDSVNVARYASVMVPLMTEECVNFTEIVHGFPEAISIETIRSAFGETFIVESIDKVGPHNEHYKNVGATAFELLCVKRKRLTNSL